MAEIRYALPLSAPGINSDVWIPRLGSCFWHHLARDVLRDTARWNTPPACLDRTEVLSLPRHSMLPREPER